jgi:uncharacterized protein GlcG (DUF336 family)
MSSVAASLAAAALAAQAQQPPPQPGTNPLTAVYGESINLENARKATAAAMAEARKNNWRVAVAIVDTHGDLVYFERMDDTQYGSIEVAQGKARTAAKFRRTTKAVEDGIKGGNPQLLGLSGAVPLEGGTPIVMNGKVVGAIGVSGVTSAQDGQCAKAAVDLMASGAPAR